MTRVSTTAFSMPAWTSPPPDARPLPRSWRRLWLLAVCAWLCCALHLGAARADDTPAEIGVAVQRTADGLFITARLPLALGPAVEEALLKAVPLYFVYQAEVHEPRWYWADKRIASTTRTLRLAYQPLTRRWRLSVATGPTTANAVYALHQNFDALPDALSAIGRVARWRVADGARLDDDARYTVDFRFRLDLSLLPRPLQIGVANQPDWNIDLQRRLRTTAQPETAEPGPAAAPEADDAAAPAR